MDRIVLAMEEYHQQKLKSPTDEEIWEHIKEERDINIVLKFAIFINNEFSINPYKREIIEKDINSFLSTLPEEKEEKNHLRSDASHKVCLSNGSCINDNAKSCLGCYLYK